MNCLCCGKALKVNCSEPERKNQWHNHCVKKFFGTEKLPTLEVTEEQLVQALLQEYDVTEDKARDSVNAFVTKLKENGFLA